MSIHGEDIPLAREQEHAGCSLRTDSFEGGEEVFCFLERRGLEERQIEFASPLFDFIQDIFDYDRFHIREPAGFDRGRDRRSARASDLFPGWESALQTLECTIAVDVGSGLRKDRQDEFIERIVVVSVLWNAVGRFEVLRNIFDLPSLFGKIIVAQKT